MSSNSVNEVTLTTSLDLNISAKVEEITSTFYYGLCKLGFLFPHPRVQISPSSAEIKAKVGKSWRFEPLFAKRGFHLHTEHPNEWVKGFLEGDESISTDYVRWLARNQQNVFEVVLLRSVTKEKTAASLKSPFRLAKSFGIYVGISVSIEFQQQKSAHLATPVPGTDKLFPNVDLKAKTKEIEHNVKEYLQLIYFDFMSIDIGTTEFTSPSFDHELSLIEVVRSSLESSEKVLYCKVHCSTGQTDPKYGSLNFNFIPKLADKRVGVLPHTVMFYGLQDKSAPVYGNKNFQDMLQFIKEQVNERPMWYYPETSYWVGIDMDIPLLLTDFLVSRSQDIDLVTKMGVKGQLTFTSGQSLGYWLFDYTVALQSSCIEYKNDPYIALRLLGEDIDHVWKKEVQFQTEYIKNNNLLPILSSANPMDEVPLAPKNSGVLERNTIPELHKNIDLVESEISLLQDAVAHLPTYDITSIRNPELRILVEVTHLRIYHALYIRIALKDIIIRGRLSVAHHSSKHDDPNSDKSIHLDKAQTIRLKAKDLIAKAVEINEKQYPTAKSFDKPFNNATSYDFGYLWTAKVLHFWEREELIIKDERFGGLSSTFMNIYNPVSILL